MAIYYIPEENLPKLEKKLTTIANKCAKFNNDFHYEKIGEEFKEVKLNNEKKTIRFIVISVEGTASVNGWEFVAEINHFEEGNIVLSARGANYPERFLHSEAICEHCHTDRDRKNTYLIKNTSSGEFKQVGKSCLKDYTGGMDAELAASYASGYEIAAEAEMMDVYSFESYECYANTKELLGITVSMVQRFGYVKKYTEEETYNPECTSNRVLDLYRINHGLIKDNDYVKKIKEFAKENHLLDEHTLFVTRMIKWAQNLDGNTDYEQKLKILASMEFVPYKMVGILVSTVPSYNRYLSKVAKDNKRKKEAKNSKYVGNIGDKLEFDVFEFHVLTSYENQFGYVYLYGFKDLQGNNYTWKTSVCVDDVSKVKSIKGSVKTHTIYRDLKQTEMTRCRITYNS